MKEKPKLCESRDLSYEELLAIQQLIQDEIPYSLWPDDLKIFEGADDSFQIKIHEECEFPTKEGDK